MVMNDCKRPRESGRVGGDFFSYSWFAFRVNEIHGKGTESQVFQESPFFETTVQKRLEIKQTVSVPVLESFVIFFM